jgi:hypothetical protein
VTQLEFGITYALFMPFVYVVVKMGLDLFEGSSPLFHGLLLIESLGISLAWAIISIWAIIEYGWVAILFYLAAIIATIPIGYVTARIGIPKMVLAGMIIAPVCAYRLITGLAGW